MVFAFLFVQRFLLLSNGLCRSMPKVKHRYRPLESWYGPAQTGPRLVPVQTCKGRSGAGFNRWGLPVGPGTTERSQETLYKKKSKNHHYKNTQRFFCWIVAHLYFHFFCKFFCKNYVFFCHILNYLLHDEIKPILGLSLFWLNQLSILSEYNRNP